MVYTTVRIRTDTRDSLRRVAEASGRTMQSVLEAAVDSYLRQQFVRDLNAGYADWRKDDVSWRAHQLDLSEWEDY